MGRKCRIAVKLAGQVLKSQITNLFRSLKLPRLNEMANCDNVHENVKVMWFISHLLLG